MICHAGLIAALQDTRWRGVLIRGASGAGKSDLTIRAIQTGFQLVADDRVLIFTSENRLFGRPVEPLRGLLEVRGLGVGSTRSISLAEIALLVDCVPPSQVERMPILNRERLLGISIPRIAIHALDASAPAKLCRALEVLGRERQEDYDAAFPRPAPRHST